MLVIRLSDKKHKQVSMKSTKTKNVVVATFAFKTPFVLSSKQLLLLLFTLLTYSLMNNAIAQDKEPYVRIAKIVIDSTQIDGYKAALKEHAKAAVSKEPGVLTLYAV